VCQTHFNYNCILYFQRKHPEDGHMSGRDMVVTVIQ